MVFFFHCVTKCLSFSAENWNPVSGRFGCLGLRRKDERRVCVKFLKRGGGAAADLATLLHNSHPRSGNTAKEIQLRNTAKKYS